MDITIRGKRLETAGPLIRGQTVRFDCPFCEGKNTFSVTNNKGRLIFFCFRDSCHTSGVEKLFRTAEDMKEEIKEQKEEIEIASFELPDRFKHIYNYQPGLAWLKGHNCMWALETGIADIKYDPKLDRIVFISRYHGKVVGATGRIITPWGAPKWYEYGESKVPFICGTNRDGVLVEDAASACAVAATKKVTGVALRGTNLPESYIPILQKDFDSLIIALDADASKTAIQLHRQLSCLIPKTRVVLLREDLKYNIPDKIMQVLHV